MKQPKLRYSEAFYSVQGEGRFVGVPSVFLRTFGCNFECKGFGQERGNLIATDEMPYVTDPRADKNHPDAYKSIEDLPVTPIGCDSSASWAMKYKHLQMTKSVDEVVDHITSLLPKGTFTGRHGEDIHLVITGGEPLLGWQRVWPALIDVLHHDYGLLNVTFETNGSKSCDDNMIEYFNNEENEARSKAWREDMGGILDRAATKAGEAIEREAEKAAEYADEAYREAKEELRERAEKERLEEEEKAAEKAELSSKMSESEPRINYTF